MQETGEQNEREKERINGNMKKREFSESESSWSSVEEIETKTERNDEDNNEIEGESADEISTKVEKQSRSRSFRGSRGGCAAEATSNSLLLSPSS